MEFWEITPRELQSCFDGYNERLRYKYEMMADMAIMNRKGYLTNPKKSLKRSDFIRTKKSNAPVIKKERVDETAEEKKAFWEKYDKDIASGKRKQREVNPSEVK